MTLMVWFDGFYYLEAYEFCLAEPLSSKKKLKRQHILSTLNVMKYEFLNFDKQFLFRMLKKYI